MASTTTGEIYSQEQFDALSVTERSNLGLVQIDPLEQAILQPMSLEARKVWLKQHKSKKPNRRSSNKRERQNKKAARSRK